MSSFIMSDEYPEFVRELKMMGHNIIATDKISIFHLPEQKHADMQVLVIKNKTFILKECTGLYKRLIHLSPTFTKTAVSRMYPNNIILNFLYLNDSLYGKLKHLDNSVKEYCTNNNIKLIDVKQGYCRCSSLVINNNAVITADKNIEKALKNNGVEVLKISPGNIRLEGFNYGFIGGAGGVIADNVVFFGNITKHPDYNLIKCFCQKHNKSIKILCPEKELTDIGGIVKSE